MPALCEKAPIAPHHRLRQIKLLIAVGLRLVSVAERPCRKSCSGYEARSPRHTGPRFTAMRQFAADSSSTEPKHFYPRVFNRRGSQSDEAGDDLE